MLAFEQAYETKYGQPSRLQLEFEDWQSHFESEKLNGVHGLLHDPLSMMYRLIDESHIAAFAAQMWGS
jgi:hypothetical protein